MIGQTVSHYRITAKLGEGGMGVVYRAEDQKLDRIVALKFLAPEFVQDSDSKARFVHEAKAASALDHPNICTIHSIEETEDGRLFIAMALYQGETLKERISRGPLPIVGALDITQQIAEGLAKAHERNIVHRDIKPANIFITNDGLVKILDFGLAKLAGQMTMTRTGTTLGTVAYMSPEQARGEKVDYRSDIFSLGIILYEMLTGEPPFKGKHEAALLYEIVHEEPGELSRTDIVLPPELENTIRRCLEKGPETRFQLASDLAYNLQTISSSLAPSITGERHTRARTARDLSTRTRIRNRIAVLLMVAIISIVGTLWIIENRRSGRPIRTMAVLARLDSAPGPERGFLCDLLAARLIATLSQIPHLEIQSQQAVKPHSSQKSSVVELGQVLGVDAVLTAEIRETFGQLIVAVEVTDVRSGMHVWGDVFKRPLAESNDVHEAIALEVAENLQLRLDAAEKHRLSLFHKYQQANYFWNQRTAESLNRAVGLFQQIIAEDPTFAEAHVGLASSYILLSYYGGLSPIEAYESARVASENALRLDETLAEAHACLGLVKRDFDRDWRGAFTEFRRTLQLDPKSGSGLQWYAEMLASFSRYDEAETIILEAEEADPLNLTARAVHGWILLCAGRHQEAEKQLRSTLQMDPHFHISNWFLGQLCIAQGDYQAAINSLKIATKLTGRSSRYVADLAVAYALNGNSEEALRLLSELRELSDRGGNVTRYEFALVYVGLGDYDRAIAELEGALEERTWQVANMGIDPLLKPLREDERFRQLLQRVGLPSE